MGCASYNQGEINSLDLSYHTSFYNVLSFRIFFYSPPPIIILLLSKPLEIMPRTEHITQELPPPQSLLYVSTKYL